jgi:hypothetical protein
MLWDLISLVCNNLVVPIKGRKNVEIEGLV